MPKGSNSSPNTTPTDTRMQDGGSAGDISNDANNTELLASASGKQKRVRTGCLTCRERHLKCDEGVPVCMNCKKSNRTCKRGVRLNFIDTKCERPPHLLERTHDFKVVFEDNSREIASEYMGGAERYTVTPTTSESTPKRRRLTPPTSLYDYPQIHNHQPVIVHHQHHMSQPQDFQAFANQDAMYGHAGPQTFEEQQALMAQTFAAHRQSYDTQMMTPQEPETPGLPLSNRDEVLFMQVFVEEVALWMDSMDRNKHFGRVLPFLALKEPMLKYAVLACGVRHLTLINTAYTDEQAVAYYAESNKLLMKSLQDPNRDTVLCATAATVLNVYEIMSETALQRMNHIAGARALIKECRWDGTTEGIGGACFWLNVGMELHSCLHFNWGVAWDPDTWNIDMAMSAQSIPGNEEEWTHKMLWILAKVTNFRSSMPRFQEPNLHAEQMRLQARLQQWMGLKQFCDTWDKCVPPSMHPMAVVPAYLTRLTSAFPEIWLVKRTTIVARLFWHTANILLASCHPVSPYTSPTDTPVHPQLANEMAATRLHHSRQVCGIVRHSKDRGVASASIRCLAAAGEFIVDRREQEEVLEMYDSITKETGWRIRFIKDELREKWGWNDQFTPQSGFFTQAGSAPTMPAVPQAPPRKMPGGIINPIYKNADFSSQHPPYAGTYVPPAPSHYLTHSNGEMFRYSGLAMS